MNKKEIDNLVTPEFINKVLKDTGVKRAELCRECGITEPVMSSFFAGRSGLSHAAKHSIYWYWQYCIERTHGSGQVLNDLQKLIKKYRAS